MLECLHIKRRKAELTAYAETLDWFIIGICEFIAFALFFLVLWLVCCYAENLGVSRGYIYKVLKTAGLLAKDFVVGKRTRGPAKRFSRKAAGRKAADVIKGNGK